MYAGIYIIILYHWEAYNIIYDNNIMIVFVIIILFYFSHLNIKVNLCMDHT